MSTFPSSSIAAGKRTGGLARERGHVEATECSQVLCDRPPAPADTRLQLCALGGAPGRDPFRSIRESPVTAKDARNPTFHGFEKKKEFYNKLATGVLDSPPGERQKRPDAKPTWHPHFPPHLPNTIAGKPCTAASAPRTTPRKHAQWYLNCGAGDRTARLMRASTRPHVVGRAGGRPFGPSQGAGSGTALWLAGRVSPPDPCVALKSPHSIAVSLAFSVLGRPFGGRRLSLISRRVARRWFAF